MINKSIDFQNFFVEIENFSNIDIKIENSIGTIVLSRSEKHNALNDIMIDELTNAFSYLGKNSSVKIIVLKSDGQSFCAGADLSYLQKLSNFSLDENHEDSKKLLRLFKLIYEIKKIVIAVVSGAAIAGGCGLATVCDFIFASKENAKFGYTESKIGFIPAIVMIFLTKKIGEGKTREMILSGKIYSAIESEKIGLVNFLCNEIEIEKLAYEFATNLIEQNSFSSLVASKEMLCNINNMNFNQALDYAAMMNAVVRMSPDCKRGITAFLNKEKIEW